MSAQATSPLRRRKPIAAGFLALAALLLCAQAVTAQLSQYTEPGQLSEREIPSRETLRERLENAPWKFGKWRLQPRFSIGDLVYDNNVFDENDVSERTADLRGSAAAGLDAYAPLADDVVFAAFVRPSYSWWQDQEQLRRLNLSYGAAIFGLFNRLSTELSVKRTEVERPISNELRVPAALRRDAVALDTRVSVRGPWQVFGSVSLTQSRYPNATDLFERAPLLDLLARDEEIVSAGLAYDIRDKFNLGVGWRRVESKFLVDPALRSNSGQYPFLTIEVSGNKLGIDGSVGLRQLDFDGASQLARGDETVGILRVSFEVGRRTSLTAFSTRDIVYSALDAGGFFTGQRSGLALVWGETGSLRTVVFGEVGEDSFESGTGVNSGRIDQGESYGLNFQVPLRWGLILNLGLAETNIDSNFDVFDRSLTSFKSSISLDLPDFPF